MFNKGKKFDVEHALLMFAEDYAFFPAYGIYDNHIPRDIKDRAKECHIYMIGLMPKVEFLSASLDEKTLHCQMRVLGKDFSVPFDVPDGLELGNDDGYWHLFDESGRRFFPIGDAMQTALSAIWSFIIQLMQIYDKEKVRCPPRPEHLQLMHWLSNVARYHKQWCVSYFIIVLHSSLYP